MRLLIPVLLAASLCARAGEATHALEFVQRRGEALPLQLALRDEAGRMVRLGDYFGSRPVVLVPGYFSCPNLCSTVLDGVLESLARAGLGGSSYRLLAFSIDPREGPAEARARAAAFAPLLAGAEAHFLTGDGAGTARLAAGLGFPYAWDGRLGQYQHPAGFAVATPDGRIARYFLGVRFDPPELRLALSEAAAGRTGSLADRLLLLCSHFDPQSGRYTPAVMSMVRGFCLLLAALLAAWVWRRSVRRP